MDKALQKNCSITGSSNYKETFSSSINPISAVRLQQEKLFFDLKIVINGTTFEAHRFVLWAFSPVFKSMFTMDTKDKYKNVIEFDDNLINFDVYSFDLVLKFMYTGAIVLIEDNVIGVMSVADYFAMDELREQCVRFMLKIANRDNALTLYKAAFLFTIPELNLKTYPMIWETFDELRCSLDELTSGEILSLLSIDSDDEYDRDEDNVFRAALSWLQSGDSESGRLKYFEVMLGKVDYEKVSSKLVIEALSSRFVRENDAYFEYVMEILRPRVTDDSYPKFKRRKTFKKSEGTISILFENFEELKGIESKTSQSVYVRGLPWVVKLVKDENLPSKLNLYLEIDSTECGWGFLTENKIRMSPSDCWWVQKRDPIAARRHLFVPTDRSQFIGYLNCPSIGMLTKEKDIELSIDIAVVITMA